MKYWQLRFTFNNLVYNIRSATRIFFCLKLLTIQAKKAVFGVINIGSKFGRLPPDVMSKMFDTNIAPILFYSYDIWWTNDSIQINWKDLAGIFSTFLIWLQFMVFEGN